MAYFQRAPDWWNRSNNGKGEWTCEGKLKSADADVGATVSSRYIGTCIIVHG